jgi:hypothetical protein
MSPRTLKYGPWVATIKGGHIDGVNMIMCNIMVFKCVSMWVVHDGFQLIILPHILIATFCMYMNQIVSNKYNEFYSLSIVCSWLYLPWLSSAFVLGHMHLTFAFITIIMWGACIYTSKLHHNWNVTKIKPTNNGNNVLFVDCSITFWATNESNHFMSYFYTTMFFIFVKQA